MGVLQQLKSAFRQNPNSILWNVGAPESRLGKDSKNQNGNLRWHLPLGVRPPPPPPPPPLMAKFPDIFLPHFFSFAIESYIYETDFTLQTSQELRMLSRSLSVYYCLLVSTSVY